MSQSNHVIVIGAGLSGLNCALHLVDSGVPVTLLEASDAPGGRVRTDIVEGFRLDRGFQVLLTAYPEAQQALDFASLDLHSFYPGAYVRAMGRFHQIADPFRDLAGGGKTLATPIGSIVDKARVGQLRYKLTRST